MWIFWNLHTKEINITKINIIPLNIILHIATQTGVWILKICNVVISSASSNNPPDLVREFGRIRDVPWRRTTGGTKVTTRVHCSHLPLFHEKKRVRIGNLIPSELSSFSLLSNGQNWGCQPFLRQCTNGLSHIQNQPIWWIFVTFNSWLIES